MVRIGLVEMMYNYIKQILIKRLQAYFFISPTSIVSLKNFYFKKQSNVVYYNTHFNFKKHI